VLACVAACALASCTDAGGQVSGGQPLFDAGADAGPSDPDLGLGTGVAFTDLYRDFFGPQGRATCGATQGCHGAPGDPGAVGSGGYVCPLSAAPDGGGVSDPAEEQCRATMIKVGLQPSGAFEGTLLYRALRKTTPTPLNHMPLAPFTYTFSPKGLARIAAWADAGAPDD
jgi:hypothetical protein